MGDGAIVRYRIPGRPEAHDLYWVPDEMLQAMFAGQFMPLPASIASQYGIHQPTEAVRGTIETIFSIIETGWLNATRHSADVSLNDLPFDDSCDFPVVADSEKPDPLLVGGPLVPLTGIPDRPLGKGFWQTTPGRNLRHAFDSIAKRQDAARLASNPTPTPSDNGGGS